MTPRQIELARHALGLKQGKRVSYRNHFCASAGHADYDDWIGMVEAGMAKRFDGAKRQQLTGGDDIFVLTLAGARAALRRGERLDSEDFPAALAATDGD